MGIGIRFYIWDEDNGFKRYSIKGFNDSFDGIPNKDLIQYAGTKIKYVMVFLETENRKPIGIRHIDCGLFTIDYNGIFNQNEVLETQRLAMELIVTPELAKLIDNDNPNVIEASGLFAIKRNKHLYSWELTDNQLARLVEDIFK